MRCRRVARDTRQGGLAFPHAVTRRVTESRQETRTDGLAGALGGNTDDGRRCSSRVSHRACLADRVQEGGLGRAHVWHVGNRVQPPGPSLRTC